MKGVILAAGEGTGLRPLTELRPKPLCPINNRPLLDIAFERIRTATSDLAINVHAHREQMGAHLAEHEPHVHVSVEQERLETAGALGNLRDWIDGDPIVVTNADAITTTDLRELVSAWDGEHVRLLVAFQEHDIDFPPMWKYAGACALPWSAVHKLEPRRSSLYDEVWKPALNAGTLELIPTNASFTDCGTPLSYLGANLVASRGLPVIGEGAAVEGTVEASVVWPNARVEADEHLVHAIRLDDGRTVRPLER